MTRYFVITASLIALSATGALADDALLVQNSIVKSNAQSSATVDQTGGEEGISFIRQIGPNNTASVTQSDVGSGPSVGFSVAANTSRIVQKAEGATATVTQAGLAQAEAANTSVIVQRSALGEGSQNLSARVDQANAGNGSTLSQNGSDLSADVSQLGQGSSSKIVQKGSGLTATLDQDGSQEGISKINQRGTDNAVTVTQIDTGGGPALGFTIPANKSVVIQKGDGAQASVHQQGDARAARPNSARIVQLGSESVVDVMQDGQGNRAVVTEAGDMNTLFLTQDGADQTATLDFLERATGTDGTVEQSGTGGRVTAQISGIGGSFDIVQTNTAFNEIAFDQRGRRNVATLTQDGGGNTMQLLQRGRHNAATLSQIGADNAMSLTQTGNGNTAVFTQKGTATQPIDVTQTGGATATIIRH